MKIGMLGVINNLSTKMFSHNAGWTIVTKNILQLHFKKTIDILDNRDDYNDYDIIVINEGVNYKENVFNFFGGVQDKQIESLNKISKYKNVLYSINNKIDYNILIKKRKELNHLDISFDIPKVLDLSRINNKLILGDSHSLSVYKKGYGISRNDGKTLNGFLKIGLRNYIPNNINDLIFYAGNIDIRFHVHRFGGRKAIVDLIKRLFIQLQELNIDKITLVSLLPIEDESRKLPGTGLYEGKPFFGNIQERSYYVKEFNSLLKRGCNHYNYNLIEWDFNYEEGLSFEDMEARQSVHIRPSSYKFINELL